MSCLATFVAILLVGHITGVSRAEEAPTDYATAVNKTYRKLVAIWTNNSKDTIDELFGNPETLALVREKSGYCQTPAMTLRSNHATKKVEESGEIHATMITYWSYPIVKDAPATAPDGDVAEEPAWLQLYVSRETFGFDANGKINAYQIDDITEESITRQKAYLEKPAAIFWDASQPLEERLTQSLSLLLNYWQYADYQHFWPVLHSIIELGALEQSEGKSQIQGLVRRAVRQGPLPEKYRADVKRIEQWK